jgi:hypothetical protein
VDTFLDRATARTRESCKIFLGKGNLLRFTLALADIGAVNRIVREKSSLNDSRR